LRLPWILLKTFFASPGATWRYLLDGSSDSSLATVARRFYLDAPLIALDPDLVHFEFGALAVGRLWVKSALRSAVVVSFRGYDINFVGVEDDSYYRSVWEKADAIHFLGEDLQRRAIRRGCPAEKTSALIPPAVDASFFSPSKDEGARPANEPLRILSVGRLEWKKGYEYGLEAVHLLTERGVQCEYRIVGDGSYLTAVAFARHQLGLDETVEFLGAQPLKTVKEQLEWADVLLHSAVSEGFCNAVLEAQAMGVPVVCTDADGLRENVADGRSGFVVPRRDPQALAASLARLAGDRNLRRRMGDCGRRRAVDSFSPCRQLDAFEELYRRAARERNE